jgi:hypothetical protein
MSSVEITDNVDNNLFDDVSGVESAAGDIEYRGFYVLNNHGTLALSDARIYISALTSSTTTEIDLGIAVEAVNVNMASIANESTAPGSVTFTRPTTYAGGLAINSTTGLVAGARRGIWIRRTVDAASPAALDTGTIKVEGDTLP